MPGKQSARRSGCPVSIALETFGDRWSLLIIRDLMVRGMRSFKEFQESGEGIATNILTDRLRKLEAARILTSKAENVDRRRVSYRLTEKGADLLQVLAALMQWGDRWLGDQSSGVRLEHHGCGEPVAVELRCAAGHDVTSGELDLAIDRSSPRSPYAAH